MAKKEIDVTLVLTELGHTYILRYQNNEGGRGLCRRIAYHWIGVKSLPFNFDDYMTIIMEMKSLEHCFMEDD